MHIQHNKGWEQEREKEKREGVMRLPLLTRDYTQSFPNYKRSEDWTLRIGWGKPPVLISQCRSNGVVCGPHFIKMPVCIEFTEESEAAEPVEVNCTYTVCYWCVSSGELSMVLKTETALFVLLSSFVDLWLALVLVLLIIIRCKDCKYLNLLKYLFKILSVHFVRMSISLQPKRCGL